MIKKFLTALAVAVVGVLLPATVAHAYGALSGPNTATVGSLYTYHVTGLPTDADVTLNVSGPAEVSFSPAATQSKTPVAGATSFGVTFPAAGTYVFTASQPENTVGTLTVTVSAASVPSDSMPNTGADATPYLWFGGGLLVLGIALVTVLTAIRRGRTTV